MRYFIKILKKRLNYFLVFTKINVYRFIDINKILFKEI